MRKADRGGLVYSTDGGRMCPACRRPVTACLCAGRAPLPPAGSGMARVTLETQGRGGKTVTVVRGLGLDAIALAALGQRLRAACGAGGTCKAGVLEVQGDHAGRVVEMLRAEGHPVRLTGRN